MDRTLCGPVAEFPWQGRLPTGLASAPRCSEVPNDRMRRCPSALCGPLGDSYSGPIEETRDRRGAGGVVMWLCMKAGRTKVGAGADTTIRHRPLIRRVAVLTAVLMGVPVLTLGLTSGSAAASGAGHVRIYADIGGPAGIVAGPDGALWFTNNGNNSIGRITTTGKVNNYTGMGISSPSAITEGPDGALWFTNQGNNSIGRITTGGKVTNFTGMGIDLPAGIAAGSDGELWFTDRDNAQIGRHQR